MKPIVLFDMDNVLMDFNGRMVELYNEITGENITKSDMTVWDLENKYPAMADIWRAPGFFSSLKPLNDALEWVPKIAEECNCYICSDAAGFAYAEKEESLRKHFGNLFHGKTIFMKDKHLIDAMFLVDDKIENCIAFDQSGKHKQAICYNQPHNTVLFERPANWMGYRIHCMKQLYEMLRGRF